MQEIVNEKHLIIKDKFSSLLKEKKDNFRKYFDNKYSEEYIRDYVVDNRYIENIDYKILDISLYLTLVGCILSFSLTLWSLFFLFQMPIVLCLRANKKSSRLLAGLWLRKENKREIIKNEIFSHSYVDQELLKAFVDKYGKNELYSLLKNKDNISYKEIIDKSYELDKKIYNEKIENNNEETVLKEAINILANMK